MKKSDILKKVKTETEKSEDRRLVPKIVYGTDKLENVFIYFKLKDFEDNSYEDDSFVLMYQNPKNQEVEVNNRLKQIIDWFKLTFECSDERVFNSRKHFFIKGKLFKTRKKLNKFYVNLIRRMIDDMNGEKLINNIKDFPDNRFLEEPALLNYNNDEV